MTREELKEHCKKQIENCEMWARCIGEEPHGKVYEEHKLILELLEQDPCTDAVSRQAVDEIKELMTDINGDTVYAVRMSDIRQLTPVTPQPKMGRWIEKRTYMECPNCHDIWHYEENQTERFKCCPTCGKGLNNESKYIRNRVRNNRTN